MTTQDLIEGGRSIIYLGLGQHAFGKSRDGSGAYTFYASTTNSTNGDGHDGVYLGCIGSSNWCGN